MQSNRNSPRRQRSTPLPEDLKSATLNVVRSLGLLHWIGYGLLILLVLDLVALFYPPAFLNPAWEFQLLGQVVERTPVLLLGLVLVFFGERHPRAEWELVALTALSWLTLLVGLVFFLMVPFGLIRTSQLHQQYQQQSTAQVDQQLSRLQALQSQLDDATPAELKSLAGQLPPPEGTIPAVDPNQDLNQARQQLKTRLAENTNKIKLNANVALVSQRQTLLKQSVKWNLGALVSGVLLVGLWKGTVWARRKS